MKKYLGLIEALNSICWFWFDFSWIQEWTLSADIGAMLALITGLMIALTTQSWSGFALLFWIQMNVAWMNEWISAATVFGIIGFILISISLWKEHNLKDFVRLKKPGARGD